MEIKKPEEYEVKLAREKKIIFYSLASAFILLFSDIFFFRQSELFLMFVIIAFLVFVLVTAPFLLIYLARKYSKSNAAWYTFLGDLPSSPGQGDKDFVNAIIDKINKH